MLDPLKAFLTCDVKDYQDAICIAIEAICECSKLLLPGCIPQHYIHRWSAITWCKLRGNSVKVECREVFFVELSIPKPIQSEFDNEYMLRMEVLPTLPSPIVISEIFLFYIFKLQF